MRSHVLRLLQLYCAGVVACGNGAVRTGAGDVGGGGTRATATTSNHDQDQGGSTAPSHSFLRSFRHSRGPTFEFPEMISGKTWENERTYEDLTANVTRLLIF